MTEKTPAPTPAPAADALAFDWDTWIGGRTRPTGQVHIHPGNDELEAKLLAAVEDMDRLAADAERAEKTTADNRGLGDASPEAVEAMLLRAQEKYRALLATYQEQARTFHLRQVTPTEIAEAHAVAAADGVPAGEEGAKLRTIYVVASAITDPPTKAEHLIRLRDRDRSGSKMVEDLTAGVLALLDVSAPFSPPSSSAPS